VARNRPSASAPSELRRARIVDALRSHEFVRVADLGEMLGVSSVTVRGDLDVLAARGDVRRIRGGAMRQAPDAGRIIGPARQLAVAEEQLAIGRAAAALVREGECVLLDAGTAALALARALTERDDLHQAVVVTNGLETARMLGQSLPRLHVMLTGGTLQPAGQSLGDPLGDLLLARVNGHVAFLGAAGIAPGAGVTDDELTETGIRSRMLAAAERRVVLATGAAVGAVQMGQLCTIDDVDVLVTGPSADADVLETLRDGGLEVIVA
jgi:DeoR family transcriptional regulator of aga operon